MGDNYYINLQPETSHISVKYHPVKNIKYTLTERSFLNSDDKTGQKKYIYI